MQARSHVRLCEFCGLCVDRRLCDSVTLWRSLDRPGRTTEVVRYLTDPVVATEVVRYLTDPVVAKL